MSWWKRKKCPLCKTVFKKKHKTAEFRIDTADGPLELTVCMGCATIMDKSADILMGKSREKQTISDSMEQFTGQE